MENPLHAPYYADHACHQTVSLLENVPIAQDTYRARFQCPRMAASITPGQFIMVRLAHADDPLIGRPLALYDVIRDGSGEPFAIDVVYLVGGKMTARLARLRAGQEIEVWGPLGNGFEPQQASHLVMVAGGIGQTPFLALAKEYLGREIYGQPGRGVARAGRVTFCYGARTAGFLAGLDDFQDTGAELRISTDDGSRGHHGLVTDLVQAVLNEDDESGAGTKIVCCGPEPMMQAVSQLAMENLIPCQVSLETPMACGIGICFTCVAKVLQKDGQWDYRRTCVDGPVFDAQQICWD